MSLTPKTVFLSATEPADLYAKDMVRGKFMMLPVAFTSATEDIPRCDRMIVLISLQSEPELYAHHRALAKQHHIPHLTMCIHANEVTHITELMQIQTEPWSLERLHIFIFNA